MASRDRCHCRPNANVKTWAHILPSASLGIPNLVPTVSSSSRTRGKRKAQLDPTAVAGEASASSAAQRPPVRRPPAPLLPTCVASPLDRPRSPTRRGSCLQAISPSSPAPGTLPPRGDNQTGGRGGLAVCLPPRFVMMEPRRSLGTVETHPPGAAFSSDVSVMRGRGCCARTCAPFPPPLRPPAML